MLKKKLKSEDTVMAWTYEENNLVGIALGIFNKISKNGTPILHVESVDGLEGIKKRILINKENAEKYGFEVMIDETNEV